MRWGLFVVALAVTGVIGFQAYSTSENTIHGLTGPRFNLAVRNTPPLAEVGIGAAIPGLEGYRMQGRYVKVAPGGTIRIHDHVGRPAFSYVVNTTVDQHRSDLSGPLNMRPGALSSETNIAHWWRNTGGYTLTFYVVDLKKSGEKDAVGSLLSMLGGGAKPDDYEIAGPGAAAASEEGEAAPAMAADPTATPTTVAAERVIDLGEAFPQEAAAGGWTFRARKIALAPGASAQQLSAPLLPAIYYVTAGEIVATQDGAAPARKGLYEAGAVEAGERLEFANNSANPAEIVLVDLIAAGK